MTKIAILLPLSVLFISIFLAYKHRARNDNDERSARYFIIDDMFDNKQHKALLESYTNSALYPQQQATTDIKYPTIGEEEEPNQKKQCVKTYLAMNTRSGKCEFLARIDVAANVVMSGSQEGWKESIPKLFTRVLSFWSYGDSDDVIQNGSVLYNALKNVYTDHPYILPIGRSNILFLPGQLIPIHNDGPFFRGIHYEQIPEWLRALMSTSNLFRDIQIPEVVGIYYIHTWKQKNKLDKSGAHFVYLNGNHYETIPAYPKRIIIYDPAVLFHGSFTFKPQVQPISLNKDKKYNMIYNKTTKLWNLYIDNTRSNISYSWDNVRALIAFRGLCFKTKKEMNAYKSTIINKESIYTVDEILDKFKNDLITNKNYRKTYIENLSPYDLGVLLMTTYANYPTSNIPWIPYNYCLIFEFLPTKNSKMLKYIQDIIC